MYCVLTYHVGEQIRHKEITYEVLVGVCKWNVLGIKYVP